MTTDLERARQMLSAYANAMQCTSSTLNSEFGRAVEAIAKLPSILVITGLGKSGLVGQKAAATFSSTGTRAFFVHPVEALHGDLGIVEESAAMLAISKSGSNEETIEFTRQFKQVSKGVVITLTEPASKLEQIADIALHIPRLPEIDEWNLAPTTSSITSMSVCDVLAICVQKSKGLTEEDFAQFHPHGTLGRRLLLQVRDLMISGDALPIGSLDASFSELIYEISSKGLGLVLLIDESGDYFGLLTDGDIRRLMERSQPPADLNARDCFRLSRRGGDLPSVTHGSASPDSKAIECLEQMQRDRITSIVILEDKRPIGLVRMQDLVAAGL
ncbi:MAG: KpsF/GutQ family sugar-phosphate isomerase [Gammaproteobacteria bacterium]|nr:KpsF/GutQ family sugar-phosphate isomerase [Gammaproteobacteria bacterium]